MTETTIHQEESGPDTPTSPTVSEDPAALDRYRQLTKNVAEARVRSEAPHRRLGRRILGGMDRLRRAWSEPEQPTTEAAETIATLETIPEPTFEERLARTERTLTRIGQELYTPKGGTTIAESGGQEFVGKYTEAIRLLGDCTFVRDNHRPVTETILSDLLRAQQLVTEISKGLKEQFYVEINTQSTDTE
jgi:hypothetical protein